MRAVSRVLCVVLSIASLALPRATRAQTQTAKERELDSLLRAVRSRDWSQTTDTLQALALRYAGSGAPLRAADSIRALASFIAAARSGDARTRIRVPYVAMRIPLPEFAPLLRELADSPGDLSDRDRSDDDSRPPSEFVREAADSGFLALAPSWFALTPLARLASLDRDLNASCLDAPAPLRVPCNSMHAALVQFRLRISSSYSARAAISAFRKSLTRAARAGLPELTVLLLAANDSLLEQSTFHVDVQPRLVANLRDSITMTYTVRVISPASDSMLEFIVDAPAYAHVNLPALPARGWRIGRLFHDRVVASWSRTKLLGAGESTPPFPVTSYGLLGLVQFLAWREEPLSSFISDRFMDGVRIDALAADGVNGARGFTVGVVPFPADLSPQSLADRLGILIDRSCELGWIDDRRTCSELRADAQASSDSVRALIARLDAQRRKHVSESAYLLLTENARFLLARV